MQLDLSLDGTKPWEPLPLPPNLARERVRMGTSGYSFEDWVGIFFPPRRAKIEEKDRFAFYQRYFSFLELNTTFYREPDISFFLDMEKRSKADLLVTVKAHKGISHSSAWDQAEGRALMERHVSAVSPLVETGRFYSFLIQLEDHRERSQKILDYLRFAAEPAIAKRMDIHIEFRHVSWHRTEVLQVLKDAGIGVCNTEIPPVSHAFPLKAYATTPKGYVRYSGRNLASWYPPKKAITNRDQIEARNARYDYNYNEREIRERADGQVKLLEKVDQLAIAYNNHYQAQAVLNAIRNLEILKEKLKVKYAREPHDSHEAER
jgi:uncharacterized protein YecE (DUF72 family)